MRSSPAASARTPLLVRRVSSSLLHAVALTCLVLIVLAAQVPSSFSINSVEGFRSQEVKQSHRFEHMFATKTKYWDQRNGESGDNELAMMRMLMASPGLANVASRAPLRQELELIQTQIVARHGIRYPTGGNIREIEAFLDKLQPFQGLLPEWMRNYTLPYNMSVEGELAVAGEKELNKLGRRSLSRSGHGRAAVYSKERYRVSHTHVARTRDSAIAFAKAFFANEDEVDFIEFSKDKDFLLRFFDLCPRYQREVKHNVTAQQEMLKFQRSRSMLDNAKYLTNVLGLDSEDINFSATDLMAVQSACAFDIALYHHKHRWCSLMSKTFIQSLDYLDDLEQFYWIGGGYKINYEMASVLLREVFDTMQARAEKKSSLVGNFFFAHAETTLPLMTLMGYGDRSLLVANATAAEIKARGFRSSTLAPFAANIEFQLFKQKSDNGDFYVQVLVNEKEAEIPGCGHVFCKLKALEHQWQYNLKTYDFHEDCK